MGRRSLYNLLLGIQFNHNDMYRATLEEEDAKRWRAQNPDLAHRPALSIQQHKRDSNENSTPDDLIGQIAAVVVTSPTLPRLAQPGEVSQ